MKTSHAFASLSLDHPELVARARRSGSRRRRSARDAARTSAACRRGAASAWDQPKSGTNARRPTRDDGARRPSSPRGRARSGTSASHRALPASARDWSSRRSGDAWPSALRRGIWRSRNYSRRTCESLVLGMKKTPFVARQSRRASVMTKMRFASLARPESRDVRAGVRQRGWQIGKAWPFEAGHGGRSSASGIRML
jgi:hypothetical protein